MRGGVLFLESKLLCFRTGVLSGVMFLLSLMQKRRSSGRKFLGVQRLRNLTPHVSQKTHRPLLPPSISATIHVAMSLISFIRSLRTPSHTPLVTVTISKSRLLYNLNEYQNTFPELAIAPVLKSNAYGHGLVPVAQLLDQEKVAFFALDSLHEALILRKNRIRSPLLILGYTRPADIAATKIVNIAFAITSLAQLEELARVAGRTTRLHLKVDTGMHRQGITENEIPKAMAIFAQNPRLILEGVCSHFADADSADEAFTQQQLHAWERATSLLRGKFPSIRFFHISASAGARYAQSIRGNVLRLGLGLYGINATPVKKLDLQPVLQLETIISGIKELTEGDCVGYNATYQAHQSRTTATIPVGYFEGIDRRLSNVGVCKVGESFCPLIGRVSMNISSLDVSAVPQVSPGDCVIAISNNPNDPNSVEHIAQTAGTIPWEILVHIPQHLRRTVVP